MADLREITSSKLLIGEGAEEERFFIRFLKHHSVSGIQVLQYGGKNMLHAFLQALPTMRGFHGLRALAVTRDADDDPKGAFQSVREGLAKVNLPAPSSCGAFVGDGIRVGVFILPGTDSPGMLETMCLQSVQDDGAMPCVEEYFRCVNERTSRQPNNMWKARTHAWLASQIRPDRRLGEAAEAGYWPLEHEAFKPLADFMRAM